MCRSIKKPKNYKETIFSLIQDSYIPSPKNYDFTRDQAFAYLHKCVELINKNYSKIVFIINSSYGVYSEEFAEWSKRFNSFVSSREKALSAMKHYDIGETCVCLNNESKSLFSDYINELNFQINELSNICSKLFNQTKRNPEPDTVFIVHGHDEKLKEGLKKALQKKKYTPILLSDKNDTGISLFEKFEKYANRCIKAIILMTKDDCVSKSGNQYFQARPNVLIEFGYFLNMLDRKDIVVLFERGCTMPSDINGVSYIEYDGLSKELINRVLDSLQI